jgi:PAP2 superfamily protein
MPAEGRADTEGLHYMYRLVACALTRQVSSHAAKLVPLLLTICALSFGQTLNLDHPLFAAAQGRDPGSSSFPEPDTPARQAAPTDSTNRGQSREGLVRRSFKRTLRDQKELYLAPLHRSNFKWDVFVLAGTGALLATDRRIERHLPGGNLSIYSNTSNVALGSLSGTLALMWAYGIKTHNEHLKEMGSLELEALVNTFLIYAPMQVIAGRQRPGEGNNHGDFLRHHAMNTSFPSGHPMFTMAMAAVVAHEYPKTWVKVLAYGAATAVIGGRLLGRHHWSSDLFVGPALGYFIGSHIFYSHCDPAFNEACRQP